jgi:hypothetical protein
MRVTRREFAGTVAVALVSACRAGGPLGTPIREPGVVSASGRYYLANDLAVRSTGMLTAGAALRVTASGVEIDLNGKQITAAGLSPIEPSFGIFGEAAADLTVVDRIGGGGVHGFWCGVQSQATGTRIEGVDLSRNSYMGANLTGDHARFYANRIENIAGATNSAYAVGVQVTAADYHIRGNTLREIYRQRADAALPGEGCAILVNASATSGTTEQNTASNSRIEPATIGYFAGRGGPATFINNTITGFHRAVHAGRGDTGPLTARGNIIALAAYTPGSIGMLSDFGIAEGNRFENYEQPISGGIATGAGNHISGR